MIVSAKEAAIAFLLEHDRIARRLESISNSLKSKLSGMASDQLKEEYDRKRKIEHESQFEKETIEDKFRFFNEYDTKPDFEYWISLRIWSVAEATALLLDREPFRVNDDTLLPLRERSPFAMKYFRLRERIQRRFGDESGIRPFAIRLWARHRNVALPLEIDEIKALKRKMPSRRSLLKQIEQLSAQIDDAEPNKKVKTSLLKIVAGLAAKHYGLEYRDGRDNVNKSVHGVIIERGIEISLDSVRTWIIEARKQLDPDLLRK